MFTVLRWTRMGHALEFTVSDYPRDTDPEDWPAVAKFSISKRYEEEIQERRAWEYAEYLNSHIKQIPPIGA